MSIAINQITYSQLDMFTWPINVIAGSFESAQETIVVGYKERHQKQKRGMNILNYVQKSCLDIRAAFLFDPSPSENRHFKKDE